MIHRVLVLVSVACCALVVVSFALFARDQLSGASKTQVAELATNAPPASAPTRPHPRGQPRRFIDDAAHTLTSPFDSVVSTDSEWVDRGAPTVLALLVYGVGLGYLARYSQGLS